MNRVADCGACAAPELYRLPGCFEPFSALSHLFGAGVFLGLGLLLLRRGRGDPRRAVFLGVYAASCVLLLSVSGIYHMTERGTVARQVMVRVDHAAIFVLIAGTCTPAHGILFGGRVRQAALALAWTAALTGVFLKAILFDVVPEWLSLSAYLAMGWLGAVTAIPLARRYGFGFIRPLLWGGIAYTVGGVADFLRWPVLVPGVVHHHEFFHLAVLAGAVCHWRFTWQFAGGYSHTPRLPAYGVGNSV